MTNFLLGATTALLLVLAYFIRQITKDIKQLQLEIEPISKAVQELTMLNLNHE